MEESLPTYAADETPIIMEDRSSSFAEMARPSSFSAIQIPQVNNTPSYQRQSRASTRRSAAGRASHSTGTSRLIRESAVSRPSTHTYTSSDANEMILKANAPPNYKGGFNAIMKQIKAKKYYTDQFQRIQNQTNMGTFLGFSDSNPTFYESNYLHVVQETSIFRVRMCFFIGLLSLGLFYGSEWYKGMWDPQPVTDPLSTKQTGRTMNDKNWIIGITFGCILPTFFVGIMVTFTNFGKIYLEKFTMMVFITVAFAMIVKKSVEKVKGPIIPLLILLIPIFGITRMRFVRSCVIGWGIFFTYLIGMGITRQLVPNKNAFDTYTDISYQTINYGISIIGGMVSQYRQELLRRRNFCLQLPFSGTMDSAAVVDIKTEKFSKHSLMHRWSQKFRNPEVEETFYRYWYLIDPFPYENPNSGSLHQGVFRTIRFAVYTTFLNQLVLLLQDIKFLKINKSKDPLVNSSDFTYAMVLRFGVTVPLYMSAAVFMYLLGRKFYARWVKEAEDAQNAALAREHTVDIPTEPNPAHGEDLAMKLVVEAAMIKDKTREHLYDILLNKGGYVRSTQVFSSVVIASHVACMGIILLAVSTGVNTTDGKTGKPKPVYYMGFLNAVLFAHRSGFRVRFIFATYTTFVVALGIIIAAHLLSPTSYYYLEYAGFVCVIFLLGMMISYEEENLRRSFFVLKSIRTLEFEEWFSVVLHIQGWVRERFRKKLADVRTKSKEHVQSPPEQPMVVVNTSAQMAQASKFGMYSQLLNIVIAVVDLITSM